MIPIIDLHCDLLGCVQHNEPAFNFETSATNCSIPQLKQGGVKLQTLAIASITKQGTTKITERQVSLYQELLEKHASEVAPSTQFQLDSNHIHCLFAIENASGLVEEDEPIELAFQRFESFQKIEKILYVSLTWNHENRFGGGNASNVGLKPDGKLFLEYLHDKNVAIDLSHTSDALAHDILNFIHQKSLQITPIASHSNARIVKNVPRNLPDEIAREIIALKGLIGLNFIYRFIGEDKKDFLKHIDHLLDLGGIDSLSLGADFYGGLELPNLPDRHLPTFHDEFSNSSCYPQFIDHLSKTLPFSTVEKIAYKNALQFLNRHHFLPAKFNL